MEVPRFGLPVHASAARLAEDVSLPRLLFWSAGVLVAVLLLWVDPRVISGLSWLDLTVPQGDNCLLLSLGVQVD